MSKYPADFEDLGLSDPRRRKRIEYIGPKTMTIIRSLRLYHATGCGFMAGRESLRAVAKWLETRQWQGEYPVDLPCSLASVQRACFLTEEYFQSHFEMDKRPGLLLRLGRGMAFAGLTDLGWDAWRLDEEFLRALGLLE